MIAMISIQRVFPYQIHNTLRLLPTLHFLLHLGRGL